MNGGSEAGVSEEQDQVYRMNLQGCVGGLGDLRYLAVPTCPHCKQVVREGESHELQSDYMTFCYARDSGNERSY